MDRVIIGPDEAEMQSNPAEFFLATVVAYSSTSGARIRLDGQTDAMTKYFKTCVALTVGKRVVVMKQSGTYVIIGQIR